MLRIGIDIGGTFTDFALWRRGAGNDATITSFKIASSPPNFAEAVREGLEELLTNMTLEPDEPVFVMHGTTVSTNAVIERSGPRLAMLTTRGFKDLLELQRLRLKEPANIFNTQSKSLVPRELVFEIDERLLSDGSEKQPIDLDQVVDARGCPVRTQFCRIIQSQDRPLRVCAVGPFSTGTNPASEASEAAQGAPQAKAECPRPIYQPAGIKPKVEITAHPAGEALPQ